jgi:hypothetical protein
MFEIGDLVTMNHDVFLKQTTLSVYEKWVTNPFGIVLQVERYNDGNQILVKVHFHSLRNSYWLYAFELELIEFKTIQALEGK